MADRKTQTYEHHAYRPVASTIVFLLASTFVLVNLFVDLLYTYLDPRIRLR